MGSMGVNIVDNAYLLGCMANQRLLLFADQYGKTVSLTTIGVDIMRGHVNSVNRDTRGLVGKLSAGQIRDYHVAVFSQYDLPARTFGGAPVTGTAFEAEKTKVIWCPSCE